MLDIAVVVYAETFLLVSLMHCSNHDDDTVCSVCVRSICVTRSIDMAVLPLSQLAIDVNFFMFAIIVTMYTHTTTQLQQYDESCESSSVATPLLRPLHRDLPVSTADVPRGIVRDRVYLSFDRGAPDTPNGVFHSLDDIVRWRSGDSYTNTLRYVVGIFAAHKNFERMYPYGKKWLVLDSKYEMQYRDDIWAGAVYSLCHKLPLHTVSSGTDVSALVQQFIERADAALADQSTPVGQRTPVAAVIVNQLQW
jgi:hypothetical protein